MHQNLLEINNLHVCAGGASILKDLCLTVAAGEVHAIMGPNGSGKSTLANVLAGQDTYEVTRGEVRFLGEDLLALEPHERARKGLFLAFQYPVEIPGVSNMEFLKTALDHVRAARGEPAVTAADFIKQARQAAKNIDVPIEFLKRNVNEGFSGGEKKRNEILQMTLLEPALGVLDETDSGLDIDALQVLARGINDMRQANRSFILITHYQRLLNHIVPDRVHVLSQGRIVRSGDRTLALELEAKGYGWLEESQPSLA